MADLLFVGQFIASKAGKTGLTVTVDVDRYTLADGSRTALITAGAATEGRRGLYHYRLVEADLATYQYVATFVTTDTSVDQQEIAALGLVVPDALVSSRLAPTDAGRTLDILATGEASANVTMWNGSDAGAAPAKVADLPAAAPTAAAIADAVWDEAIAGHVAAGSTGKALTDVLEDTGTTLPAALAAIDDYIDTEIAAIKAKTDLITASGGVTVVSPVDPDTTDLTLYAGDDYAAADSRAAEWSSSSWPDLTDATVTLYLRSPSGATFSKSGSAPVTGSGEQTVRVELTAAETALLESWPSPAELRIRATLASGRTVTLVDAETIVVEEV